MEKNILKHFEQQFGKEWVCNCGSSFDIEAIEITNHSKNSFLAKYSCKVCGREQIFAVSTDVDIEEIPALQIPSNALTTDDVLDIRKESAKLSLNQIKALAKKRNSQAVSSENKT